MDEEAVKEAALNVLLSWTKEAVAPSCIHPQNRLLWDNGNVESPLRISCSAPNQACVVEHVQILSVGLKNAAHAKVVVGDTTGFLVFLHIEGRFQCISGAFGAITANPITPKHTMDVASMVWDGYCDANTSCRGDLMANVFHDKCRLTFVDGAKSLHIIDKQAFCDMVTNRYSMEVHQPFAHLKDSVGEKSTLISIDFATPNVAMVTLKVGHPPYLWTDLLTCMKIGPQWWIVHKSSCHEAFFKVGDETSTT